MKFNYVTLVLSIVFFQFSAAQQMPVDFSDSSDNFIAFDGSGFSFNTNPEDANNPVGQFFNNGAVAWQGFYLDLNQPVNLASEQTITLSFYSFDPNSHNVLVKLENGTEADVEVVQTTTGSGWTTNLTFNFANATFSGTNTSVNATGTYSRLVVFIDGGQTIPGTYLIDDIDDGSEPTDPHALDVIYNDLVWADEFDTNGAVNANNWFHQTQLPAGGNWFNGEAQHYTDRIENSSVDNGFLNITAIKETFTDQGETKQYTSARLNSKFAFTYGRVDVRAKLPFGEGTWPAIWTLGKNINEDGAYWDNQGYDTTNWPACGEIDIMEHGLGAINHVSSAIHTPSSFGATINYQAFVLNDVANEFHVYSVNWSPNKITFLIDGVGFYTYNPVVKNSSTWPFDEDQYLLLNIAMGGVSGTIDPNFVESSMVIDYVRVYQNNSLSANDNVLPVFNVFPNPTTNRVSINTTKHINRLELYNALGQLVAMKHSDTKYLDMQALTTGIYTLRIHTDNATTIKRIIKN